MNIDWYIENLSYQTCGRGDNGLVDCYGLVRLFLMSEAQIDLPLYSAYHLKDIPEDNLQAYFCCIMSQWQKVSSPCLFDVVFLWFGGAPSHCGCMLDDNRMINIRHGCNVAVESIYSVKWNRRVHSFYRFVS